MMTVWSLLAAICYLFVGSIVQIVSRRRLQLSFYFDFSVGLVLIGLFVFGGIAAEYHNH